MLGQGGTSGAASVVDVPDLRLCRRGARSDNSHSDWFFVLQREVDQTLVNDPAHHLAVESLAFMNEPENYDDIDGGLLEETFGQEWYFV